MQKNNNQHIFSGSSEHQTNTDLATPNVYFRGVNRIQINRFKAYILIVSNRLKSTWNVTQDVKSANVVVEWVETENSDEKYLRMSVLAGTANLKPPVISAFKLSFIESELCVQLNQASKQLHLNHQDVVEPTPEHNTIKVAGLLNESLSQICTVLNSNNNDSYFIPCVGIFSAKSNIFRDKLLLMVDPQSPESIHAYQTLMHKKLRGDLVINELTIAIITKTDEDISEEIFDMIYDNSDNNTLVTLVNFEDEAELNSFVAYF